MNSEKDAVLVRNVGIVSALLLVLLIAGVSYFFIRFSSTNPTLFSDTETPYGEPTKVTEIPDQKKEQVHAAVEMARINKAGGNIQIGESLEGHPGVYVVPIREIEESAPVQVDGYGNYIPVDDPNFALPPPSEY